MIKVQLYISGEEVELFKDETIKINDSIQNVRDISKIFTTFSKQFSLPASRTNNKIFKHYYNYDITNGFDARFKVDALIKLNGSDYKKGKLRLNDVMMKDNKPYSYKVVFFGETVTLGDLLGDDDLKVLGSELTAFDQTFNASNTLNGFIKGWTLSGSSLVLNNLTDTFTGDFIYPFISAEKRYYYDTSEPTSTSGNNLYISTPSTYVAGNLKGLHYADLKPAIRVYHIIKAIETKYNITFSTDFFNTTNLDYYELFLWLHREKGNILSRAVESTYDVSLSQWVTTDTELRSFGNTTLVTTNGTDTTSFEYKVTVNVTGTGLYDIVIQDESGGTYFSDLGLTGNQTKSYFFSWTTSTQNYVPKLHIQTVGGITAFNTSLVLIRTVVNSLGTTITTSNYTFNSGGSVSLSSSLLVGDNLPKIKVIDFLTGIFKLFNLTAYIEDGVIVVKPLDNYYASGVNYDITKYVEMDATISRGKLFSKIDFKFQPPKTLFAIKSDELNNFEFGNLKYESASGIYDGGKYEIVVPFEHMLFERIQNPNTGTNTDTQWGYYVDKDEKPVVGAPLLFYAQKQTATNTIYFDDESSYTAITRYMKPANTRGNNLQSINFGSETDEYNLNTNTQSLFENYYKTFINDLFDIKTRIIKVNAYLPLSILLKYTLADRFIINGKKYKINNIDAVLQTRKTTLELITEI